MTNKLPLGFIYFPGPRATAYLNVLRDLDIAVDTIIVMKNDKEYIEGLAQEAQRNNYKDHYFDISYDLQHYIQEYNVKVLTTEASHINDVALSKVILDNDIRDWIFSGGGILKPHLFQQDKRYIHVHPGKVPDFRGSTCFYYSVLHDLSLASTAFFMSQRLDDGENLAMTEFSLNLQITEQMPLFFDYILDPWIRAISLKKVLSSILNGKLETLHTPSPDSNRTYYVMHPILRNLALNRLNDHFDPKKPAGIFECQ